MATKSYDSERQDYKTQNSIYQPILDFKKRERFFEDVCCSEQNIPALFYIMEDKVIDSVSGIFSKEGGNGLKADWYDLCFLNPPFKRCKDWLKKAVNEVEKNDCEVWAVLPSDRLETVYYRDLILKNPHCVFGFLTGKQGFIIPGEENEKPKPSQKIMIACFSKKAAEIAAAWEYFNLFNTPCFVGG